MFDLSLEIRRALPRIREAGGVGSIGLNLFVSAGGNRPTASVVRAISQPAARQSRSAGAFCRQLQIHPQTIHPQTLNPNQMNHTTPKPQKYSARTTHGIVPIRCRPVMLMCSLVAMFLLAAHYSSLLAAPKTEVIVETGDPAPDKDGTFNLGLGGDTTAVLNNCGWAAFRGSLVGTTLGREGGEFLADGTTRTQVARTGDPAPGGLSADFFRFFSNVPALNDGGQILFEGRSDLNNQIAYCIFRSNPLTRLFDGLGQAAPGGNGTVFLGSPTHEWPAFNDKGLAAFVAHLTNTQGGSNDDSAIYRTSTPGKLTQIAREGQPLPEGNGTFGEMIYGVSIVLPAMNATGQVAFVDRSGISVVGIYRGDGKTPIKIARIGDPLPGGGTLSSFSSGTTPDINDPGEVVFAAVDNSVSVYGIFKWSGGTLTKIARHGDTIPNSSDTLLGTAPNARINKAGQVAFVSNVSHTNPNASYFAIFRGDGNAANTKLIAAERESIPVGRSGIFSALNNSTFCINASGQIAFTAGLTVDTTNEQGIYLFDGSQILQVARTNDTFVWPDGKSGKINALQLSGTGANTTAAPLEQRSGLNNAGQVVFGLTTTLADNTVRYGIAIWSPTLKLLCASSRKSQGGKNFDVDLPLTGKLGVECRSGGAQGNFTLVLRFTNKLTSVGSAIVTTGVGSVYGSPTINGNTMTVNLTGVGNAQKMIVTINNVADASRTLAKATVPMGILLGDVDGNKTVNSTDVNAVSAKVGTNASLTTFRDDVNVSGSIDQTDVSITQNQLGRFIP